MNSSSTQQPPVTWDLGALYQRPVTHPAPELKASGVKGMFLEGLPYQGKPTRVFAWYGLPDVATGQKVPAMVLVHGLTGTAFSQWVRLWTARGYAAIAIDWNGQIPQVLPEPELAAVKARRGLTYFRRHEQAGPPVDTCMNGCDLPMADQWQYHAVAAIIQACSFLASQPEVDADRIGLTGISWGAYLSCIISGVDHRFKFIMPVYGCGFLDEESIWGPTFVTMGPDKTRQWMDTWDPSRYVGFSDVPMLFISGPNDPGFGFGPLLKTAGLAKGPVTLCIRPRMVHGHEQGYAPAELYAFADSIFKGSPGLVKVLEVSRKDKGVFINYELPHNGDAKVVWGELIYTTETNKWLDRRWQIEPVELVSGKLQVKTALPEGTIAWYVNLIDSRGLLVSADPQGVVQTPAPS